MNDPSLALAPPNPLVDLVSRYFSHAALGEHLGAEAAALGDEIWSAALRGPLLDFLDRPSKEFRAGLVASSYALTGGRGSCPVSLQQVVEILHAGSLIIDDIQDESQARRGRPALHRAYGLPVALNAGNWLYFCAFQLLDQVDLEPSVKLNAYRWMSRQLLACHHGQALDLTTRVEDLDAAKLGDLVLTSTRLKTGSLLKLAAILGALAAGAPEAKVECLATFGERLGVALQMLDDVGGLLCETRCHKGHEDLRLGRPTWPWAWLAAELPLVRFEQLQRWAGEVTRGDLHPEVLARALRQALQGSGRVRVRRAIQTAFADLKDEFGPSPALQRIESEIRRMERSYA
jgi:geranylgeranyl pyrophosphate synthase